MIRVEKLVKSYGKLRALDGLDLQVDEGAIYGFLGPNGAGKTTTLRILSGLARPQFRTGDDRRQIRWQRQAPGGRAARGASLLPLDDATRIPPRFHRTIVRAGWHSSQPTQH